MLDPQDAVTEARSAAPGDLAALYARVPKLTCKGRCHAYCGVIVAAPDEVERIVKAGGERSKPGSLDCPYLSAKGRCEVYAVRPLICRLWGTTKRLRCPHGCRPDRWLSEAEAKALIRAYRERFPEMAPLNGAWDHGGAAHRGAPEEAKP